MNFELPEHLAQLLVDGNSPEAVVTGVLPALCEVLQCDRCFLHVRNPQRRIHQNLCWRRDPSFPDTSTKGWEAEQEWERDDPMFAAALRTDPSIFVEDIETAGSEVLNIEFERKNLGHRALVHAHICEDGVLWGILQPCVFEQPRHWNERDRWIVKEVVEQIKPFVIAYVQDEMAKQRL